MSNRSKCSSEKLPAQETKSGAKSIVVGIVIVCATWYLIQESNVSIDNIVKVFFDSGDSSNVRAGKKYSGKRTGTSLLLLIVGDILFNQLKEDRSLPPAPEVEPKPHITVPTWNPNITNNSVERLLGPYGDYSELIKYVEPKSTPVR